MELVREIISVMQYTTETPRSFSSFHIASVLILLVLTVLSVLCFKDCYDKTFRRLFLGVWIVRVVLEIYRDLVFALRGSDSGINFKYACCSSDVFYSKGNYHAYGQA